MQGFTIKYKRKSANHRQRQHLQHSSPRINGSADRRLKSVFSRIGVPKQSPFQPDPFQTKALAAIQNADCLVSAPTGSGKTWIAVEAIDRIRKMRGRAWYASPLKALSNSKFI